MEKFEKFHLVKKKRKVKKEREREREKEGGREKEKEKHRKILFPLCYKMQCSHASRWARSWDFLDDEH